jgi:spore coat polysaccharide biosynthesis predicted glycosyltransferase SpsG
LNEDRVLKALVVCHAGGGLGLGHLTRALVAARTLQKELGAHVKLLIQGDEILIEANDKFEHQFLSSHESLTDEVALIAQQNDVDLVVFDLHPMQVPVNIDDLFVELRSHGRKLIAVDGLAGHSRFLDLVFIPAFQFQPPQNTEEAAKFIYGWDCFLLNVQHQPRPWQPGKNVLILSGGSDATQLGRNWPRELNDNLPENIDLHWITGPFAQAPIWPEYPRIKMHNHIAPSGLGDFMGNANYAITVYGVSFYELLYCGVPTVVFSPYSNKDNSELTAIAEMGVALVATDEHDAIIKLIALMENDQLASTLSLKSLRQMSVHGGHRFASCIAKLMD